MVKGLRLFWHSLWQLFGNLPAALMISALPAALMVGLLYALNLEFLLVPENLNRALARGLLPCGRLAVFVFAAQAAFCWIAVGWHRFVLMEEPHGRGIPPFHLAPSVRYCLATLLLSLLVLLPLSVPIGILSGIYAAISKHISSVPGALILSLIFIVPSLLLQTIMLRAGVYLPGLALGRPERMSLGWNATRLQLMPLFVLLALLTFVFVLLSLSAKLSASFYPARPLGAVWAIMLLWFQTMLGLSVVTTLYGRYIQNRPLRGEPPLPQG